VGGGLGGRRLRPPDQHDQGNRDANRLSGHEIPFGRLDERVVDRFKPARDHLKAGFTIHGVDHVQEGVDVHMFFAEEHRQDCAVSVVRNQRFIAKLVVAGDSLDVPLEGLPQAIGRVFDSVATSRVSAYKDARAEAAGETSPSRMAVLVQVMAEADSAGVAFTANPVTGELGEVIITAVRRLGERLVSGEAVGDEWLVRGDEASCRREREGAISAEQAVEVAELARRVEAHFGSPQDIEWAISGNKLYLLQARPMTALSEPVEWKPPRPGYWMRNFRLGEWLPEAMTPLYADWLLALIEDGYLRGMRSTVGTAIPFS
jgi:hypothetical protein